MANGEWVTERERRQTREQQREAKRLLAIEFADKLWLAQNHPADDSVLAWLSEHRSEASKIGASRWNLETLPGLVATQAQLRKAARFEEVLARATISHQTLTAEAVLGDFSPIPQDKPGENQEAAQPTKRTSRKRRRDAGIAKPRTTQPK
jgi:hypothetical protein